MSELGDSRHGIGYGKTDAVEPSLSSAVNFAVMHNADYIR
jgi:hypothetical protein